MSRRLPVRGRALLAAVAVAAAVACTDGDGEGTTSSTTTPSSSTSQTIAPDDPELSALLLTTADLPPGFVPAEDVDDTITTFCAGQDAAAGLQASGRAVAGFTREQAGASVIELLFRFDDGAAQFVEQAEEVLRACHEVPDASGLAFRYEPLGTVVSDSLAPADASAGRFGTSIGSGELTTEVAVVQEGELGALVAVLGLDEPRADLDALAATAFGAALDRLEAAEAS
ncbi:MAG TPA: hypothetical protein VFI44_01820 [Ornithinibacter sp.]|nr:hypothetical protein [Ornithinibacter sp.]